MWGGLFRKRIILTLTAMIFAAGSTAVAQEDQTSQLVREGIENYLKADLINALQKFKTAVDAGEVHGKTLAEAYKYLAVCQFALGDKGDAVLSFTRALEQDPELILPGDEFNPALVRIFDKLRAAYVTNFEINSHPAKTTVYIDGVRVGETPLVRSNVFRTSYRIRLERDRYEPVDMVVDLKRQNSVTVDLQEICGVREISLWGMKDGKFQERVSERNDAITLNLSYTGCVDVNRRIRRMEWRDTITGRIREIFPVFFPQDSGVVELVMKTPPQGWQPGRFEFRSRALDAAEEEEGTAVQFAVER